MPGWQVIGWALVLCLPLTRAGRRLVALPYEPVQLTAHGVAGLLWVAAGSQFLGLVVWYRGMAAIGIPKASQLQLAQPLLTLVWSVLLLGEHAHAGRPADGRGRAGLHRGHPAGPRLRACSPYDPVQPASPAIDSRSRTATPARSRRSPRCRQPWATQLLVHGRTVGQHDRVARDRRSAGPGGQSPVPRPLRGRARGADVPGPGHRRPPPRGPEAAAAYRSARAGQRGGSAGRW